MKSYKHYPIAGYPSDVAHIVSDEGLGKNDYIETTRSIVAVSYTHLDVYKRQI